MNFLGNKIKIGLSLEFQLLHVLLQRSVSAWPTSGLATLRASRS